MDVYFVLWPSKRRQPRRAITRQSYLIVFVYLLPSYGSRIDTESRFSDHCAILRQTRGRIASLEDDTENVYDESILDNMNNKINYYRK